MNGKNITENQLADNLQKITDDLSGEVKAYTFSSKEYLNGALIANVHILHEEIERFINDIKLSLTVYDTATA